MSEIKIRHDCRRRKFSTWEPIVEGVGCSVQLPYIRLPDTHPCYGCIWYPRDVDVLFCPFQNCIRYKEGFTFRRENQ